MHKMIKGKKQQLLRILIFIVGFSLCTYPLISGLIENKTQKNTITTYELDASTLDKNKIKSAIASAKEYNSILYQTYGSFVGHSAEILSDSNYQQQLNLTNNSVMGIIEIPKINVHLPIYHGTNDAVLSKGIGHVKESSLPVGGINTRCLLTGHRGLPTSKLFTRLDELIVGDYFFVKIYNQTNAYQINHIDIIKPEDTNQLQIIPDKDLVSLITCTPYGINTHRLVITGERVEYQTNDIKAIQSKFPSLRESIFTILPFLFIILVIILIKSDRKEHK